MSRALPQSKEALLQSFNKRLKDDVRSILDNFTEIVKTAKVEEESQVSRTTQSEQDHYEMHVRASNIVRAGESLTKLVSELKQFLILNDFAAVNEAVAQRAAHLRTTHEECDRKLVSLRDDIATDLYELEEEFYSSSWIPEPPAGPEGGPPQCGGGGEPGGDRGSQGPGGVGGVGGGDPTGATAPAAFLGPRGGGPGSLGDGRPSHAQ
uniref:Mediator of RNA polymerase II transcription subunit 22 n=1 Tax=Petromyzon marinus TaxID=7757 RepID=A0AAJ7UHW1_PETMA|nr:mediator of RNA polymerase II transcription subunit 22 isoform X1 [Petromyzon marinus]